ncbi:MAG: PAS domain-containing protein [Balneolaceae bacterium]|nr:MAG: PAS domain-containing protein [Balneolaceae bacterium]
MRKLRKSFFTGFQAGIEAIDANVAVIDRDWNIVITNGLWKTFGEDNGYIPVQIESSAGERYENYLEVLKNAIRDGEDTALKAFIGINAVMNEERDSFELDYPCHAPDGRKRWFKMHAEKVEEFDLVLLRHQNITRLHTTELELQGTGARLNQFFQNTLDGIIIMGADGRILEANPRAAELLRYDVDEILSENRDGIFDKFDEKTMELVNKMQDYDRQTGDVRMKTKSGQYFDAQVTASSYADAGGELHTNIIFRQIIADKSGEKALISEKKISESVVNSLPGVVYMVDKNLKFVRWNRNLVRVTGYTDDQLREMSVLELFHEGNRDIANEKIRMAFDQGEAELETEILTREGQLIPFRLTGVRFVSDESEYLIGTGLDMVENRKLQLRNNELLQLEREARKAAVVSRNEMEKMIQYAPSPICFLEGTDLRITIVNNAFRQILGVEKLTGRPVADILGNIRGEVGIEQIRQVFETDETYSGMEIRLDILNTANGSFREYYLNILLQPVRNMAGEVYGVFIQAMDVTEVVKSRIGLQESLREKQVLIEEVHHRVKNNLAIITGLLELQIDQEDDERTVYQLRNNQLRIYSMAAIHEMLYHNERLSEINFAEYIRMIVDKILLSVETPGLTISWDSDLEPVILSVNQAIPLAMILNEVVSNACKHAFPHKKNGKLHIGLSEVDGRVKLTVKDNGIGCDYLENNEEVQKLGTTLIQLLSAQLRASHDLIVNGGTKVNIRFQKDHQDSQDHQDHKNHKEPNDHQDDKHHQDLQNQDHRDQDPQDHKKHQNQDHKNPKNRKDRKDRKDNKEVQAV